MTAPAWQYHQPDHPGANFDAAAGSYDRNMQKFRDIQGEIEEILGFLDLQPDQALLEMGTGTGEFALAAACRCARVYAVDLSFGMLDYAARKAQARGIGNVDFLPGGFLTYRHHGRPLQAIVSQIALHHLPDFWKQISLASHGRHASRRGKAACETLSTPLILAAMRETSMSSYPGQRNWPATASPLAAGDLAFPDVASQAAIYADVLRRLAPRPVVIRTYDLGGKKGARQLVGTDEPNPVLGLRGVRHCLARPESSGRS